jgi:hypothetical protein
VKRLLTVYMITVGSKLSELVNVESMTLDSLSYATVSHNDSIQIFPVFHNRTRNALVIVDGDSLGMPYHNMKLSATQMEQAEDVQLWMTTCQGKSIKLKITTHNTNHQNRGAK